MVPTNARVCLFVLHPRIRAAELPNYIIQRKIFPSGLLAGDRSTNESTSTYGFWDLLLHAADPFLLTLGSGKKFVLSKNNV